MPTDPALEPTEALGELCRQQRERYGYSLAGEIRLADF